VQDWNGVSFLEPLASLPKTHLFTDASSSWGCAPWLGNGWFPVKWDSRSQALFIAERELIPVILACSARGLTWDGIQVVATQTTRQWWQTGDYARVDPKI